MVKPSNAVMQLTKRSSSIDSIGKGRKLTVADIMPNMAERIIEITEEEEKL